MSPSVPLWAGFECGRLEWCGQDLLIDSRHTPDTDMKAHYRTAIAQGAVGVRDGLPWRHNPLGRLEAVSDIDVPIVWDLCHYDPGTDPVSHALTVASAYAGSSRSNDSFIAVNEPLLWPTIVGRTIEEATTYALKMMRAAPDLSWMTCDLGHVWGELHNWTPTDAMVDTGLIRRIGVNLYAQFARVPLGEVLRYLWDRYRLPIVITETGLHPHHHENDIYRHIVEKRHWLDHVQDEVASAQRDGVTVEAICWYPWFDTPVWGRPEGSKETWPCGFPALDEALRVT